MEMNVADEQGNLPVKRPRLRQVFCSFPSRQHRKRAACERAVPVMIERLETRRVLTIPLATAAPHATLAETTQQLISVVNEIQASLQGAISQIVFVVHTAESGANNGQAADSLSAAQAGLGSIFSALSEEFARAVTTLDVMASALPSQAPPPLQAAARQLGLAVQDFTQTLTNAIQSIDVANSELPSLTINSSATGNTTGAAVAATPVPIANLGQSLVTVLATVEENADTLAISLNSFDSMFSTVLITNNLPTGFVSLFGFDFWGIEGGMLRDLRNLRGVVADVNAISQGVTRVLPSSLLPMTSKPDELTPEVLTGTDAGSG